MRLTLRVFEYTCPYCIYTRLDANINVYRCVYTRLDANVNVSSSICFNESMNVLVPIVFIHASMRIYTRLTLRVLENVHSEGMLKSL